MRALLDANVILRTLLPSNNPARAVAIILRTAYAGGFTLLATDELLDEVIRKATTKPALARYIPQPYLLEAISTFRQGSTMLPRLLLPPPALCRDSRDDYLLAYAEFGHSDYLVTDDEDLIVLDGRFPFRIVRPPDFLAVLRDQGLI